MDPDKLLVNARKCMKTVISDPTDANAGLELAEAFRTLDDAITCVGMLPTDWVIGKKLTWEESETTSLGGAHRANFILKLNGNVVGHVYFLQWDLPGDKDHGRFVWQADLVPSKELPYKIECRFCDNAGDNAEDAMRSCDRYVWEQIATVFDPWKALAGL
jgi:hypothetical protein